MKRHPIIEVVKIEKTYDIGQPNEFRALRGVSFKIYAGDFIIILGPSGCGKSTLLHCLAGLEIFDSGEIKIRGEKMSKMNEDSLTSHRRNKIGMVFQQFNLIKNLSVLQNVALPRMLQGKSRVSRISRAKKLLTDFGLGKMFNRIPSELSGGQQQRVAIARALVNAPWILLVDEPTGNLDSKSAKEVMKLIVVLNKKSKRTIVLVTHNPGYLHLASRVIKIQDGKIVK
ncbi:MAG: putative ABC transport system ATP-binding protein [Candidatus Berkelbacteria bacterium Licking1014_7]|uniref:Putative ABC transport system ATP-binding protein n=1 Tax=Candidatus Berkelbacteria bacterium Licking1014_7 TaxID=2017147 RepID=A0A554LKR4_9BACT|nr:MAG: putative ABC transport system ATP-binding protein [Candidatus Berkelbacteria bacterium Licking1014_7]